MTDFEGLIRKFVVESSVSSPSQKGDVSKALLDQGFFDDQNMPESLKTRKKFDYGNPIDVLEIFKRQN